MSQTKEEQSDTDSGFQTPLSYRFVWRKRNVRRDTFEGINESRLVHLSSPSRAHDELVIGPSPSLNDPHLPVAIDMVWYNWWVWQQVERQPAELFSILPHHNSEANSWKKSIVSLWREVCAEVHSPSCSIDKIIVSLVEKGILSNNVDDLALLHAKNLVFAAIGWQTMLYRPDMGACSPAQLAIVDETDGHRGQAHMCLRQLQTATKKSLHDFLLGFGVLLPCRNFGALASEEDKAALKELKSVSSTSFNAHLLITIGRVTIKWTDSLACHLEFDTTSDTLYIFRYPSFCNVHLPTQGKGHIKSTLHACAAPPNAWLHWATSEEVTELLQEVLLSYRLLFGQSKASRQLFRSTDPFHDVPEEGRDRSLTAICGSKQNPFPAVPRERDVYDISQDFPMLSSKIVMLMQHLRNKRPRTWKELWNDKRDSTSWYTFWAVIIIGGTGITLSLLQVILQIVQIAVQVKGP